MSKIWHIARAAIAGAIALLVTTALSAAQDIDQPPIPKPKPHAAAPAVTVKKPAKAAAIANMKVLPPLRSHPTPRSRKRSTA